MPWQQSVARCTTSSGSLPRALPSGHQLVAHAVQQGGRRFAHDEAFRADLCACLYDGSAPRVQSSLFACMMARQIACGASPGIAHQHPGCPPHTTAVWGIGFRDWGLGLTPKPYHAAFAAARDCPFVCSEGGRCRTAAQAPAGHPGRLGAAAACGRRQAACSENLLQHACRARTPAAWAPSA